MDKQESQKIKNICTNHHTTIKDIIELVKYHKELLQAGEIKKAQALEYGLYIIFKHDKRIKIKHAIMVAMLDMARNKKKLGKKGF